MESEPCLEGSFIHKSVVKKTDLEKFLKFYDTTNETNITFNHMLIKNNSGEVPELPFLKFLIQKTPYYVFVHGRYSIDGKILQDNKISEILFSEAKKRFALVNNTGELGELILFLLLESNGIVQLVNKMILKTSRNEHYRGSDAVHIQIKNGEIILHFGEAKTNTQFNVGLTTSIKSLEEFIEKKEEFEFSIIAAHMDNSKFDECADVIKKILLPYSTDSNKYKKHYPVFLGFEWNELKNEPDEKFEEINFETKYHGEHAIYNTKIESKVKESKINNEKLDFYILPLRDVKKFREKFISEIR